MAERSNRFTSPPSVGGTTLCVSLHSVAPPIRTKKYPKNFSRLTSNMWDTELLLEDLIDPLTTWGLLKELPYQKNKKRIQHLRSGHSDSKICKKIMDFSTNQRSSIRSISWSQKCVSSWIERVRERKIEKLRTSGTPSLATRTTSDSSISIMGLSESLTSSERRTNRVSRGTDSRRYTENVRNFWWRRMARRSTVEVIAENPEGVLCSTSAFSLDFFFLSKLDDLLSHDFKGGAARGDRVV
jgi:hypothetical protein